MKALLLDALGGLRAQRAGAAVALAGLSVALAACLLVAMVAVGLAQPAPAIPEPGRLVVLDFKGNPPGFPSPWFTRSPVAFAGLLKQRQLPLEAIARASQGWLDTRVQGIMRPLEMVLLDPDLVPLLGLRALYGDLDATLRRRDAIALTPAMVRQLWGELPLPEALGRSVDLEGRVMSVTAIVPERDPRDPLWKYEALAGYDSQANAMTEDEREAIFVMNGRVFVRLQPGVSAAQLGPWMREAFMASPRYLKLPSEWREGREPAFFRGLSVLSLPFEGEDNEMRWQALTAVGAASGLLLAMAALNLLSLQSATLLQRQRETALRRSLGASGGQLLRLWGTELGLLLLASAGLALLLAWWAAPLLAGALGLDPLHPVADPVPPLALLGLAVVVVLLLPLTLVLPAWGALHRAPAPALQGRTASEGPWGRRLRQALLTVQMGGTLLLLALTGVMGLQQRHLLEADRGYAVSNRLYLGLHVNPERLPDLQPLIAALDSHPAVRRWAFSSMRPARDLGAGALEQYVGHGNAQQVLRVTTVSSSFFDTYGMRILAGQATKAAEGGEPRVVLDAKAAKALGFPTPQAAIGALVRGGGAFLQPGTQARRVVAVLADVSLESAREAAMPQAFVLSEASQWDITVHGEDLPSLQRALEEIWQRHGPPIRHTIERVDRQRAAAYELEARLSATLAVVAGLAMAVAMLGAYALVADTLRRRRTEIVLRRLHGAGDGAIALQLGREFASPLLVAALLGLPLAAVMGEAYLGGFVDRVAPLQGLGLSLTMAFVATLGVTALASARHLRLALRLQPVEALG